MPFYDFDSADCYSSQYVDCSWTKSHNHVGDFDFSLSATKIPATFTDNLSVKSLLPLTMHSSASDMNFSEPTLINGSTVSQVAHLKHQASDFTVSLASAYPPRSVPLSSSPVTTTCGNQLFDCSPLVPSLDGFFKETLADSVPQLPPLPPITNHVTTSTCSASQLILECPLLPLHCTPASVGLEPQLPAVPMTMSDVSATLPPTSTATFADVVSFLTSEPNPLDFKQTSLQVPPVDPQPVGFLVVKETPVTHPCVKEPQPSSNDSKDEEDSCEDEVVIDMDTSSSSSASPSCTPSVGIARRLAQSSSSSRSRASTAGKNQKKGRKQRVTTYVRDMKRSEMSPDKLARVREINRMAAKRRRDRVRATKSDEASALFVLDEKNYSLKKEIRSLNSQLRKLKISLTKKMLKNKL